ncbi:MAG TPA: hypothetical protein VGV40_08160 [Solirubrobacteraceae bacterium]|nr:hypothetical protein [Solirubrobacteraceae bacterium]
MLALAAPRLGLAHLSHRAPAAHSACRRPAGEEDEHPHQQQHGAEGQQQGVQQPGALLVGLGADGHVVDLQQAGELVLVGKGRDDRREAFDLDGLGGPGDPYGLAERAAHPLALGSDALHVARRHLLQEGRTVGDLGALGLVG